MGASKYGGKMGGSDYGGAYGGGYGDDDSSDYDAGDRYPSPTPECCDYEYICDGESGKYDRQRKLAAGVEDRVLQYGDDGCDYICIEYCDGDFRK